MHSAAKPIFIGAVARPYLFGASALAVFCTQTGKSRQIQAGDELLHFRRRTVLDQLAYFDRLSDFIFADPILEGRKEVIPHEA